MELLVRMLTLYLIFLETAKLFSKMTEPFCIPISCIFSVFANILMICLFDYTHPSGCKVVSPCDFDSYILEDDDIEHLFRSLLTIGISLKKCLFRFFAPFKIGLCALLLSLRVLCIFWIQVPCHIYDSHIFSVILWIC